VGHAKSICLNFGLARDYGGVCHLRFDDTNPEKEDTEYVDSILDAVQWLGFNWESSFNGNRQSHLYHASDYFDFMYRAAEYLIEAGHAYVDEQTAERCAPRVATSANPAWTAPFAAARPKRTWRASAKCATAAHEGGSMVCAPRSTWPRPTSTCATRPSTASAAPRTTTPATSGASTRCTPLRTRSRTRWSRSPTASARSNSKTSARSTTGCSTAWPKAACSPARAAPVRVCPPQPHLRHHQQAQARAAGRRKHVSGWDDPRMPTLVGLRRRGYTPESIQLFAERIGVTKSDSWIDYGTLEGCLREDLENKAHRGMAVLDPVKLVLTNWAEAFGSDGYTEDCTLPALPHSAIAEGQTPPPDRVFKIGKEVWIEREDFEEVPPKGYKRLFPGNVVRLKGGYVIECTGCAKDANGAVTEVHAKVIPGTKSGTPGADSVKAKAAITWVGAADGVQAEVRLYDRLFSDPNPDAGGKDFIEALNPNSLKVVTAYVEPSLAAAKPDQKFQFERFGYFVADRVDHVAGSKPVFNRVTGLKDSWGK
jgi:glutaminyl-tRNA synthetase